MKYKLIKEYPGSPKLGYIDDLNKSGHNRQGEYVQSMYDKNPEFWELVVEKDYEILSLVASERNPQHKKGSKFLHNKDYKFKNMHPTEFWDIYSVKRISDNKIFTIGDSYEDLIIEKMFMSVAGDILTKYKHNPKLVEKDYEILSFKSNEGNIIDLSYFTCEENFIGNTIWKIHSVKRLSDSEIFTIGDKCSPIGKYRDNIHSITKIWFCNPGYLRLSSNNYTLGIKDIQKVKIPLFTTEDGVDIFERNNIYWVNINTFEKVNCNKYNDDLGEISIKSLLSKQYECKATGFSTKEKAEEYILRNKPCLSVNDVLDATSTRSKNTFKTLENLVKSKIQQSV